jgi:hypothetical protein
MAVSACVFCRDNTPHEKHLTLLEYTRMFGGYDAYTPVLVKSAVNTVAAGSSVGRKVA